jgi:hypothetical protein
MMAVFPMPIYRTSRRVYTTLMKVFIDDGIYTLKQVQLIDLLGSTRLQGSISRNTAQWDTSE